MKKVKLTRDCTCPRCGFKTMARKCRQCGQLFYDDNELVHRANKLVELVDDEGRIVMIDGASNIARKFGKNPSSVSLAKTNGHRFCGYTVRDYKEEEE